MPSFVAGDSRASDQPPVASELRDSMLSTGGTLDEAAVALQGKLTDNLIDQQKALLAIMTQGGDTRTLIQSFQLDITKSIEELRGQFSSMEDNIVDRLRSMMQRGEFPSCSGSSIEPKAVHGSAMPVAAGNRVEHAHPAVDAEYSSSFNMIDMETTAGFADQSSPTSMIMSQHGKMRGPGDNGGAEPSKPKAAVQLHNHYHASSIAEESQSYIPPPPDPDAEPLAPSQVEIDFMKGDSADVPAHDIHVKICGKQTDLVNIADSISIGLVILNTIFTGLQCNNAMEVLVYGGQKPKWIQVTDVVFTFLFAIEFSVRWWLWGRVFFLGRDQAWNIIDALCVSSSLLDTAVVFLDVSFVRIIRLFRIIRVIRALRGLRFIRDLRLLLAAIMASMSSLFWGCILLCFVVFIFAITVMQSLVVLGESFDTVVTQQIFDGYGTVLTSMITLFQGVSGGRDWNDLLTPLTAVSKYYTGFYILYINIMCFGVMNVLTAVFCENASHINRVDPGLVIESEIANRSNALEQLKKFFAFATVDKDGMVKITELNRFFQSPERQAILNMLEIDVAEARALFNLLDVDKKGVINLNSYIDALMRMKGAAKGCDTAMLMVEHKRLMLRLTCLMCYTHDSFSLLFAELNLSTKCHALDQYIDSDFLAMKDAETKGRLRSELCSHLGQKAENLTLHHHIGLKKALSQSWSKARHGSHEEHEDVAEIGAPDLSRDETSL